MDKSEPTLVPQWLRSSGNVSGNGTSVNLLASSSLRPDDHLKSKVVRKNSFSNYDQNIKRSSATERITSSYFRRSSSTNGSDKVRTSSSFSRNQRDRDWDGDICGSDSKDRSILGDSRLLDYSDHLGSNILNRVERKNLRRSQSMISDQRGEAWPRKVETGSNGVYKFNSTDPNRVRDNGLMHKVSFERDFPSLGEEEKLAANEIKRVISPGLSPAIHSFPVAASAMIGSDKWTSALAEVPGVVRSSEAGPLSTKPAAPSLPSVSSNILTGPSMAETVAHGPPHVQTPPQLSTESQRQELAIKQSRQLIPVTPSLPKALVSSLPDKQKSKIGQPVLVHSPRGGSVKPDLSKTSNIGKLQVLKPVRERNGVPLDAKDGSSPISGSKTSSSVPAACQSVAGSYSMRGPINSGHPAAERKHVLPLLDKRAGSQSHTQSRSDFFSLMRKKSISNSSSAPESSHMTSLSDKFSEGDYTTSPVSHQSGEDMVLNNLNEVDLSKNRDVETSEADVCNSHEYHNSGKNGSTYNSNFFSEEEEAAFLRSLGWEENTEEGGLTDEEIKAFYRDATNKFVDAKSSWKIL
ncbi:hypothetical protein LIER_25296 [Lithospermum erythrorhizon]|uniref:Uncharacterized protein n=1 Tax=Lithospermum erythrorhizon TaxID=34254 RepID=A0AAV3R5N6_LITER